MATLDVIARHPERFEVVGLTAQHRLEELFALCLQFKPRHVVVATAEGAKTLGAAGSPRRACRPRCATARRRCATWPARTTSTR